MCRLSASRAPKPSEQGFTLIELMVALSIFSLAALALVRVQGMAVRNTADLQAREIASIVLQNRKASISLVQRHLRIGYNRAARLLEQMEKTGLVSSMSTNGNRDILVPARKEE